MWYNSHTYGMFWCGCLATMRGGRLSVNRQKKYKSFIFMYLRMPVFLLFNRYRSCLAFGGS